MSRLSRTQKQAATTILFQSLRMVLWISLRGATQLLTHYLAFYPCSFLYDDGINVAILSLADMLFQLCVFVFVKNIH